MRNYIINYEALQCPHWHIGNRSYSPAPLSPEKPKDSLHLSYDKKWECWSGYLFCIRADWLLENDLPLASWWLILTLSSPSWWHYVMNFFNMNTLLLQHISFPWMPSTTFPTWFREVKKQSSPQTLNYSCLDIFQYSRFKKAFLNWRLESTLFKAFYHNIQNYSHFLKRDNNFLPKKEVDEYT